MNSKVGINERVTALFTTIVFKTGLCQVLPFVRKDKIPFVPVWNEMVWLSSKEIFLIRGHLQNDFFPGF